MNNYPDHLDLFNDTYEAYGFYGVLEEVEDMLTYGKVKKKGEGLYCILTAGYSDDEEICRSLIYILSKFGNKHYVGYLRGGAYYFSEIEHDMDIEIIRSASK
jgi:hypothetical protein